MRISLSVNSKKRLKELSFKQTSSKNFKKPSEKLGVFKYNIDKWFYNKERFILQILIPETLRKGLTILEIKEDNHMQIKGGKINYIKNTKILKKINIMSPLFLEFYRVLLRDEWMSRQSYNCSSGRKKLWQIEINNNKEKDKEHLICLKRIVNDLFNRKVKIKYKKNSKGIEIIFSCKQLILLLNSNLNFPMGKKYNLKIFYGFVRNWNEIKYIIRDLFDTIKQVYNTLTNQNFRNINLLKKECIE